MSVSAVDVQYLDIVGQLRGHQVLELVFTQGAGGSVFPSVRLELGDKGADGSFHDGLRWKVNEHSKKKSQQSCKLKERNCSEKQRLWSHLLRDAVWCVTAGIKNYVPPLWPSCLYTHIYIHVCSISVHWCKDQRKTLPSSPPSSRLTLSLSDFHSTGVTHHITAHIHSYRNTHTQHRKKKTPPKGKIVLMIAQTHFSVSAEQGI